MKIEIGVYVKHAWFGLLYVIDSSRDCYRTAWTGIGQDGVAYNFYDRDVKSVSLEEFKEEPLRSELASFTQSLRQQV